MRTIAELDRAARASGEFDARPDAPPPVDPFERPPLCLHSLSPWLNLDRPGVCLSCSNRACPWGAPPDPAQPAPDKPGGKK